MFSFLTTSVFAIYDAEFWKADWGGSWKVYVVKWDPSHRYLAVGGGYEDAAGHHGKIAIYTVDDISV